MNEVVEYPITVNIRLSEGSEYHQPLELDSDGAQEFMDWFRDPKAGNVWTWQVPSAQRLYMFHRCHIVSVDVYGYIEPEYNKTKWHQRIKDKYLAWKLTKSIRKAVTYEKATSQTS